MICILVKGLLKLRRHGIEIFRHVCSLLQHLLTDFFYNIKLFFIERESAAPQLLNQRFDADLPFRLIIPMHLISSNNLCVRLVPKCREIVRVTSIIAIVEFHDNYYTL